MFIQPLIMPILPSLIMGLIATVVGAYPFLVQFKIIPNLFTIPPIVQGGVLLAVGVLMLLDSLLGFSMA